MLDLNLPRKDGREVLREIKEDEELKRIPVVVLTTSKAEEDIVKSYSLHANCYVTKPLGHRAVHHRGARRSRASGSRSSSSRRGSE